MVTIIQPSRAWKKPARASSTESGEGNVVSRAVDGDFGTRWSSTYPDPQWYEIDLQTPHDITNVKIFWQRASARDYRIEQSNDRTNWTTVLNVRSNNLADAFTLSYLEDISKVHLIRLLLTDAAGNELGRNFYWRSSEYLNYPDLNTLPQVSLKGDAALKSIGDKSFISISLSNPTNDVAVMTRLKLQQQKTGKRILPAFYSDNYISLVPGETQTVEVEFNTSILERDNPRLLIEGWNIKPIEINIKKSTR